MARDREPRVSITIRMPVELRDRVAAQADARDVSETRLIVRACELYVAQLEAQEPLP